MFTIKKLGAHKIKKEKVIKLIDWRQILNTYIYAQYTIIIKDYDTRSNWNPFWQWRDVSYEGQAIQNPSKAALRQSCFAQNSSWCYVGSQYVNYERNSWRKRESPNGKNSKDVFGQREVGYQQIALLFKEIASLE